MKTAGRCVCVCLECPVCARGGGPGFSLPLAGSAPLECLPKLVATSSPSCCLAMVEMAPPLHTSRRRRSIGLPYFVQGLDHFVVDDEDDGHV